MSAAVPTPRERSLKSGLRVGRKESAAFCRGFSYAEADELYLLVGQAWELKERGSPYFLDACEAIAAWGERRHLRRLEREHGEMGRILRLLRDVNERTAA